MSYEAPFETSGAPDGEYSYPHDNPTITEAWEGYEHQEMGNPGTELSGWFGGARKAASYSEQSYFGCDENQSFDTSKNSGSHSEQSIIETTQAQLTNLGKQLREARQTGETTVNPLRAANHWMKESGIESEINTMRENINAQEIKRWSALMGGGFLTLFGLRRSLGSLTLMGFGLGLAYYALTGRSPLSGFDGRFTRTNGKRVSEKSVFSQGSSLDSVSPVTVKSIIVKAPLEEVYRAWSDFENFPRFMQHIKSVTKTNNDTSHWMMEGPFHTRLEWDAEMTRHEENKRIAWSSIRGDIKTSGQVTFNALPDEQVEVTVMLKYIPPAGLAGDIFARLFSDPEGKLDEDLRNFKRYIETTAKEGNNHEAATYDTAEPVTA